MVALNSSSTMGRDDAFIGAFKDDVDVDAPPRWSGVADEKAASWRPGPTTAVLTANVCFNLTEPPALPPPGSPATRKQRAAIGPGSCLRGMAKGGNDRTSTTTVENGGGGGEGEYRMTRQDYSSQCYQTLLGWHSQALAICVAVCVSVVGVVMGCHNDASDSTNGR
ncbi:hypothetical protein LY78DRAFT_256180 [Colletotrichum sublineola]|nr:hypothetical protein LY78DRAFT_256180 [Colletotrichum sublineola]